MSKREGVGLRYGGKNKRKSGEKRRKAWRVTDRQQTRTRDANKERV